MLRWKHICTGRWWAHSVRDARRDLVIMWVVVIDWNVVEWLCDDLVWLCIHLDPRRTTLEILGRPCADCGSPCEDSRAVLHHLL